MRAMLAAALLLPLFQGSKPAGEEAPIAIQLPLGRVAYQTNESIELAIVRSGAALRAGTLALNITSDDGSKLGFTFPVAKGDGRATEHLRLNGRLLRPAKYAIEASI